jgi:hypothetical protein
MIRLLSRIWNWSYLTYVIATISLLYHAYQQDDVAGNMNLMVTGHLRYIWALSGEAINPSDFYPAFYPLVEWQHFLYHKIGTIGVYLPILILCIVPSIVAIVIYEFLERVVFKFFNNRFTK